MNALRAEVETIQGDEFFNIVELNINNVKLKLLKTEIPPWMDIGDTVECQIQEASISVCKGAKEGNVSIENHIEGVISKVLVGDVLCELTLDTPCGEIKSLITSDACRRMSMSRGERVTLLLKAVDIKLHPVL
ncbi:MAG: TOBE domain-containing protein [Campylobacterota bacterium]|nr:TOBE domain-containing protein [Campylobacterota bacterium]